jgi:hypothetical protein
MANVLRTACAAAGIVAVFALTVIFLLLLEFIIYLTREPRSYLMAVSEPETKELTRYRRLGLILLAIITIVMIAFSAAQSFWFDEMVWTIGKVANKSFADIVEIMLKDGYNAPLYYLALAILYPLVPFGEGYLLSMSIVAVIAGIVFLYLAAKRIGGKKLAFIVMSFAAVSPILLTQGAWELRPYAFLFCFSAMTLWGYFRRIREENWTNIILFGLIMILLIYTHWYGAVMLLFYGIGDVMLCFMKKVRPRFLVSYLMAFIAVLPWFVVMSQMLIHDLSVVTVSLIPKWLSIINSFNILLNSNSLLFIIFAAASIITTVIIIQNIKAKQWCETAYLWIQTLMCILCVILVTFIYSRYLNPAGSVYMERYFFVIAPHMILLVSFGLKSLSEIINSKKSWLYLMVFLVFTGVIGYTQATRTVVKIHQPYREVAELLAEAEETYLNDTLVLTSAGNEAWLDYYFRKRGYDIPANVAFGLTLIVKDGIPVSIPVAYEELFEYDKIFVWYNWFIIPPEYTMTWQDETTNLVLYEK